MSRRKPKKQKNNLNLTKERFQEIMRTSSGFAQVAYTAFTGIFINGQRIVIQPSVILFNMHNSFELILKALRFLETGKTLRRTHKLAETYRNTELKKYKPELDSLYLESVKNYEIQQENVSRKIASSNLENVKEYHPSNFLNTLTTLDNMDLEFQRYSYEHDEKWELLPDLQFLFTLQRKLWEYVSEMHNAALNSAHKHVSGILIDSRDVHPVLDSKGNQRIDPNTGYPLYIGKVDFRCENSKDQRIVNAVQERLENEEGYKIFSVKPNSEDSSSSAIKVFTQAIESNSNDAKVYYNRGIAYEKKGELDKAIQDFNKAVELDLDYADAYYSRGAVYGKNGEVENAIQDYTKAIDLDSNYANAYYNRGIAYSNKSEWNKAIQDYTKATELAPGNAIAYKHRGNAYDKKGELDKAIQDYNTVINLIPVYADVYLDRGAAYISKDQLDRAIQDFTKAIELNRSFTEAYNNRGIAYHQKGKLDRAIQDFTKAIELNSSFTEAYSNRGVAYTEKEDLDRAIQDYDIAINLKPDFAEAYNNRGTVYHGRGESNRAIQDYDIAINLKPEYALAYNNRGVAWLPLSEWEKAKADLIVAKSMGIDIVASFHNEYEDIEDFEAKYDVKVPEDIAALLRRD